MSPCQQIEFALECNLDNDYLRCYNDQLANTGGSVNIACAAHECRRRIGREQPPYTGEIVECSVDRITTRPMFDDGGTTIALRVWIILRADLADLWLVVVVMIDQAVGDPTVELEEVDFDTDSPARGLRLQHGGYPFPWDPLDD